MLAESASSDKREKQKLNRNICSFFNTKQGCKFGDSCRFQHEVLSATSEQGLVGQESNSFSETSSGQLHHDEVLKKDLEGGNSAPAEDSLVKESNSEDSKVKLDESKEPKNCHHYLRLGWCRFGKRCRFSHPKKERGKGQKKNEAAPYNVSGSQEENGRDREPSLESGSDAKALGSTTDRRQIKKQLCKFYLNGHCKFGRNCRYSHSRDDSQKDVKKDDSEAGLAHTCTSVTGQRNTKLATQGRPAQTLKKRGDLTFHDVKSLNITEREQLKKRFPEGKLEVLCESDDEASYKLHFAPTDPDWPFDIKEFLLQISISPQYPLQMFEVKFPDNNTVPDTVRRHIEARVFTWLEEKQCQLEEEDRVELVFRPFLRWLDRNLESIVTEGLRKYQRELAVKAAGFEFVPAKAPARTIEDDPSLYVAEAAPDHGDGDDSEGESDGSSDSDGASDSEDSQQSDPGIQDYSNVERKGTEIMLRHLQLKDQATTLVFHKLAIVIQCSRCKTTTELSTPAGRINSIQCTKCNNEQRVVYRPTMAHHFSAVIGYLDLAQCSPFDLVLQDATGTVGCANCSRDMTLEGLSVGQVKQTFCRRCHQKLTIAVESIRFQQLQPSDWNEQGKVHQIQVSKVRRLPKDPAIQEGKPLPAEGTCKHYKKSFRWLRFPCCGKCYPCDICHDDKEGDHEMKYASRMICGFCCKEQPYSVEKPCVLCGSQLTKTRSTHWEGGRGCRDKIRMSRYDDQKYANMNKTVSKKAQEKLENKKSGKKTTKLRHS